MVERFVLVHGTGNWAPTRGFWVSQGSTCLLYKAVNQQQAPSTKLQPAPALLRLDLFYLKEPFEVGLFMHMESSCFELAGEHTNRGSHFFHRNSLSPRSLVYESEFSTIEPALDMYDENKT